MPKNSSAALREAARALAAAEGISYTAALRRLDATREAGSGQLPLDSVAAEARVIDCTGFNGRIGHLAADDELIKCQGIWEHASAGDREETGPCEHWDYYAIGDAWNYSCHEFFDGQGAAWDPDALRGEGTLTIPAGRDDEWADWLWQAAIGRFDGWIGNVVSETRKGRHLAPADGVRPRSAPGGEWVLYVTPEGLSS